MVRSVADRTFQLRFGLWQLFVVHAQSMQPGIMVCLGAMCLAECKRIESGIYDLGVVVGGGEVGISKL